MGELSGDNKPAASFKQSKTPGILYQVQIIKKCLYIPFPQYTVQWLSSLLNFSASRTCCSQPNNGFKRTVKDGDMKARKM